MVLAAFLVALWMEHARTENFRRQWEKTPDRAAWLEWAKAQPELAGSTDRPRTDGE